MGKPAFCICKIKGAVQLRGNCAADLSTFVFATYIVQSFFFQNPNFQAQPGLCWTWAETLKTGFLFSMLIQMLILMQQNFVSKI